MGKIKEFFVNELIDQILEAAIAMIAIGFGVNYFLLADYWFNATEVIAKKAGLVASSNSEIGLMMNAIANTFPFNYLVGTNLTHVFIAGIIMIIIGLFIKIITTESRAELVKDFGKILVIPGIIGVVSLIFIQLITSNSVNNLLSQASLRMTENLIVRADPGILVWNMMGMLFMLGLFLLFLGYILRHTIKRIGGKPVTLYIIGDAMIVLGWFGFIFYAVFRILAIESIAKLLYGTQSLKIFTLMWYVSRSGFMISLGLFAFGLAIYKHGKKLERTRFGRARPELAHVVKKTVHSGRIPLFTSNGKGNSFSTTTHSSHNGNHPVRLTLPSERKGRRGFY